MHMPRLAGGHGTLGLPNVAEAITCRSVCPWSFTGVTDGRREACFECCRQAAAPSLRHGICPWLIVVAPWQYTTRVVRDDLDQKMDFLQYSNSVAAEPSPRRQA